MQFLRQSDKLLTFAVKYRFSVQEKVSLVYLILFSKEFSCENYFRSEFTFLISDK